MFMYVYICIFMYMYIAQYIIDNKFEREIFVHLHAHCARGTYIHMYLALENLK